MIVKNIVNKICCGESHDVKIKIRRNIKSMAFAIIFDGCLESEKVAGYLKIAQVTEISVPAVFEIMYQRLKITTLPRWRNF